MRAIQPFAYGGINVRVIDIAGEPWFVAADVAKALGFASAKDFVRGLDDEDKGRHILPTPSGDQDMTIISEPGLYTAILRSRAEGARDFKRWVTREVIPSIRKTGAYGSAPALTGAELIAAAVLEAQQVLAARDERIKQLEPKADAWDTLADVGEGVLISRAGHILSETCETSSRKIFAQAHALGLIFKRGRSTWQPYQTAIEKGLMVERLGRQFQKPSGDLGVSEPQSLVTPKGMDFLRGRLPQRTPALMVVTA